MNGSVKRVSCHRLRGFETELVSQTLPIVGKTRDGWRNAKLESIWVGQTLANCSRLFPISRAGTTLLYRTRLRLDS